eukprot:CAMPEP_0172720948 /NCGR_PEP_ID=MMETSP1074-20121228/78041_1 /TAXON_ID=2916 /ORGANISM="Ceratium fusus, Strain PA161109" /LENGTH=294 /DNA_ID=CAMNT_0013546575 /DNA_START=52 /DNA_END=936 /DNA_ORIENTATION=-
MSVASGFFLFISVLLGLVIGTTHGCISGAGRVLPMHPLAELMKFGFERVWGPFLGLRSPIARLLTGLHEMLDGVALLICVLFDAFGFFGEELSSLAKALSIVTGISCMFHSIIGAMINYFIDGTPGIQGHLALASGAFVLLRLCVAGPETFSGQTMCAWLSFVPVCVAMFILLANKLYGQHQSFVHGEKRRLHELREEAQSNVYRYGSHILGAKGPIAQLVNRTPLKALGLFPSPPAHHTPHRGRALITPHQETNGQGNPVFEGTGSFEEQSSVEGRQQQRESAKWAKPRTRQG